MTELSAYSVVELNSGSKWEDVSYVWYTYELAIDGSSVSALRSTQAGSAPTAERSSRSENFGKEKGDRDESSDEQC
jgi:hypothetical protein